MSGLDREAHERINAALRQTLADCLPGGMGGIAGIRDRDDRWTVAPMSDLWRCIAEAVNGPAMATAMTLLALVAWRVGDPIADTAIQIALQTDARCSLARLVAEILECGRFEQRAQAKGGARMNAIVRYAIARLLREHTAALIAAQQHAVVGIYRRPRKTLLRELTAVQQFLANKGTVAAYADALPEAADRIREDRLRETTTGLVAIAFLGERHTDHHGRSRIGTVVFDDGAVAYLSSEPDEAAPKWELFEDGVQVADRWMIGLSMTLAALTGKPRPWGGAA